MEAPSPSRVAAAYSPFGTEWVKFVEWVQKKYPKQKFTLSNRSLGSELVQDLRAGSKIVAQISVRSYSSAKQYSVGVFGDTNAITWVVSGATTMPSFEKMKSTFETTLKAAPLLLGRLNAKDLHPEYAPQLKAAWAAIDGLVKSVIKVPLEKWSGGDVDAADAWVRYDIKDDDSDRIALLVTIDFKARKFEISSFSEKFTSGTFPGFITLLGKLPQIIKKGLSTLPAHEAAALTGKVTSENLVSRIVGVKARFATVDEWHDTNLEITLMLTTAKPVSQRLLIQWVLDHWAEVLKLAPSKVPAPSTGRGRSDDYDGPAYGLGWISPNKMSRPSASEMSVVQDEKRAVVHANATHRG